MSDEQSKDAVPETEQTENAESEESEESGQGGSTRMPSQLSRQSDYVERPGFRNPGNKKSKAQKKRKGKKKR